jgi:hypothetical protein
MAASWRVGVIAVPHRVQNLSLGSASLPHSAQVQPVRRKRAIRELIRSPPAVGGADGAAAGAGVTAGGGAADDIAGYDVAAAGGAGIAGDGAAGDGAAGDGAAGDGAAGDGVAAAALAASYRALASDPDSRSPLIARTVSRSRCDRSGAVAASDAACLLSRSTASSICSVGVSGPRFRYAYQSSCCRIHPMEPHVARDPPATGAIPRRQAGVASRPAWSRPSGRPRPRRRRSDTRARSWWTPARRCSRPPLRPAGSRLG